MTLFFARHGESEANVLKIFANDGGSYGLTEHGKEQAEQLANIVAQDGIDRVYASPLMRAQQTAQIVCQKLGLPFETVPALKEFGVGNHEGSCDPLAWQEYGQVEKSWLLLGDHSARIGGGECFEDIKARFMPFINNLIMEYGETDCNILCIGHGGTYACMLPLLFENVDLAFAQAHPLRPASLIIAEYEQPKFYCLKWTDTEFGQPASEPLMA